MEQWHRLWLYLRASSALRSAAWRQAIAATPKSGGDERERSTRHPALLRLCRRASQPPHLFGEEGQ